MKYQGKLSGVKVFAASHTSGSLIHPAGVSGLAKKGERTVLETLSFTEELATLPPVPSPPLESRAVPHQRKIQRGLHHPGLTSLAPQVVLHSYAPHPPGHYCIKPITEGGMGPTSP